MLKNPLKLRYIFFLTILPFFFPGFLYYPEYYNSYFDWYWLSVIGHFPYYLFISIFVFIRLRNTNLKFERISLIDFKLSFFLSLLIFSSTIFYYATYGFEDKQHTRTLYMEYGEFLIMPSIFSFISFVIIRPFVEEVMFRGFLISRLTQKGFNNYLSIIISSFLFGLLHDHFIVSTIFGVIVGVVYIKTGSLKLTTLIHSITNFMIICFEVILIKINGEYYSLEFPRSYITVFTLVALFSLCMSFLFSFGFLNRTYVRDD